MTRDDLIKHGISAVILEHGNQSLNRDIKVVSDKELSQYRFVKLIGKIALFNREYREPFI